MRLPRLALLALALALPFTPASAQALRLSDSLVAGAWEIPDISPDPDRRFTGRAFFTKQHTFEMVMWMKEDRSGDSLPDYVGIRYTGTWFIKDTLLGTVMATCEELTAATGNECPKKGELNDSDYATVEVMDTPAQRSARVIRDVGGWRLPFFHYAGTVRDMREPEWWKEAEPLSLRRDGGRFPGSPAPDAGMGSQGFDALGRSPPGSAPVRLFRPLPAVNSR